MLFLLFFYSFHLPSKGESCWLCIPGAINPLVGLLKYPAHSPLQYFRPFPSILLVCGALGLLERKARCASFSFGGKLRTIFQKITLPLHLFIVILNISFPKAKIIAPNLAGTLPSKLRSPEFLNSVLIWQSNPFLSSQFYWDVIDRQHCIKFKGYSIMIWLTYMMKWFPQV